MTKAHEEPVAPIRLRVFVFAVFFLAAVGMATLPVGLLLEQPWMALLLWMLAAFVSIRPVRFLSLGVELTGSHPIVILSLAALGPMAAGLISVGCVVGTTLGKMQRPRPLRLAFNLGCVSLSAVAAAWVFRLLGGVEGAFHLSQFFPLAAATAAYFVANTGMVAMVIALEKKQGFLATWRGSLRWTIVGFSAGLTLAVSLKLVLDWVGPLGLALGIPPCWLLAAFYRVYRERLEEQRRRIEEIEALNASLEEKVVERTREIEETAEKLRESNRRLVEASQAKSEFLANVSHELRTPLNAIIGFSDLLHDRSVGGLNERQSGFVCDIHDSGEHLLALINDILDLSKIEVGKMEIHREPVDVAGAVRDTVAMVSSLAAKERIDLTVDLADGVGTALVDGRVFRQILVNLLSNALKFTPAGGSAEVRARAAGRDLLVQVADTGIGIAPEDLEKIFHEFYQADGSYSREYQGTGLGLALVKSMVELHDGSIEVESEVGKGTTFFCRFPDCHQDETAPAEVSTREDPAPRIDRSGRTILVVEDDPLNRKLARNALRSHGYEVLEAETGEAALELVRSGRPDLILMDIQLPGMDGLEVTRRLKDDPLTAPVGVVALTAFAQPQDREKALQAGCSGYITKPIRIARLPAQIDAFLLPEEGAA